jgi:hypothetical protein
MEIFWRGKRIFEHSAGQLFATFLGILTIWLLLAGALVTAEDLVWLIAHLAGGH